MIRRWFVWIAACAAACVLLVQAQGVVVCGSCGREAKPGDTVCSHCKVALSMPKPAPTPSEPQVPVDAALAVGRIAAEGVEACLRQARELEAQQPHVALCYYQNALALIRLVPAGTYPEQIGDTILSGNKRTLQALARGAIPCKPCGGTGRYQLDMGKVDRRMGIKAVEGLPCPACKGTGAVPGFREVSKVKMLILQGRAEFEHRQMVVGEVKVGRAFVSAALEKQLTNREKALIMTGMPTPCSECQFCGRQSCSGCKGSGWTPCNFEACDHGVLKDTRKKGTRTEKLLNQEAFQKCPKCEGLGEMHCPTCHGSGGVVCRKCDGSGLAPRCVRCSATGLMPCKRCKGSGEVKGTPCPECKGETVILCSSCRGEGALSR